MEYQAICKNALISDQKMRKIVNDLKLSRRPVSEALDLLNFVPKKGAKILAKVLTSAVANAENNGNEDRGNLRIVTVQVDRGMRLKRVQPAARGRSRQILKRRCHVTIVIGGTTSPMLS
ncbi:MAG: 50S ribosomal protein L22 [Gammaproteobacteria bacterium]|nr:50S ribosomal protein L22 [Gammaproteobacteria bacterium]